jgi:AhpD family alkylhydroperoxidase
VLGLRCTKEVQLFAMVIICNIKAGRGFRVGSISADRAIMLKVRASQLNGCAFCLGLHVDFARKAGVSQKALDLVVTWREARIFTDRRRIAVCAAGRSRLRVQSPHRC